MLYSILFNAPYPVSTMAVMQGRASLRPCLPRAPAFLGLDSSHRARHSSSCWLSHAARKRQQLQVFSVAKTAGSTVQSSTTLQPAEAISFSGPAVAQLGLQVLQQQPAQLVPKQFPPAYYDEHGRLALKNLTIQELEEWCVSIGEQPKRAMQLWRWMYYDSNWIRSLDDAPAGVTNGFSAAFRETVEDIATIDGGLDLVSLRKASDGTTKMVFRLKHGPGAGGQVETVLIPIVREQGQKPRITLCVSSQVGCAMNCQFCYTGRMGLRGNLTAAQIVEQVVAARRLLFEEDMAHGVARHITPITNIVFMGMGEPLHNMDAVVPSINILTHPLGLHLSNYKISVSTVGLVDEMRRFAQLSRAELAVSLHATTDEVRDWIVPVNRKYGLQALVRCMEELFPRDKSAPGHGRHVLIEYTMLRGVNDSEEDARRLLQLTRNIWCKINLIVFNPHEGTQFQPSTPEQIQAFRSILIQGGHVATVRDSRGDDQMAACGQLGNPGVVPAAGRAPPLPPILAPPERLRPALAGSGTA